MKKWLMTGCMFGGALALLHSWVGSAIDRAVQFGNVPPMMSEPPLITWQRVRR